MAFHRASTDRAASLRNKLLSLAKACSIGLSVIDGAMNGTIFRAYVEQVLAPTLRPGDLVIMDNLGSHKVVGVREAIEARGASLIYLPAYSPDLNPIEQAFAKLKSLLRKEAARSVEALWNAIGRFLSHFTRTECANYFSNRGYTVRSIERCRRRRRPTERLVVAHVDPDSAGVGLAFGEDGDRGVVPMRLRLPTGSSQVYVANLRVSYRLIGLRLPLCLSAGLMARTEANRDLFPAGHEDICGPSRPSVACFRVLAAITIQEKSLRVRSDTNR